MLAVTRTCLGACAQPDRNALFKKLTGLKVLGTQIINDGDARGISDELAATVQCNAEEAARRVIVPAVVIAGLAAVGAGVTALLMLRRRPRRVGHLGEKRRPYKRPKKEREPVFFVDPETGDVLELEHSTAEYKKLRGLGATYRVTVRYPKFPTPTSLCVGAASKAEAAELVQGAAKGVKIVRVKRGC
jgi:hypothetical protein